MTNITYKTTPALADEYFALKAEQAELANREKALKEAMLKLNTETIDGKFARVTISHIDPTDIMDSATVKKILLERGIEVPVKTRAGSIRFIAKARVVDTKIG